MPRFVDMLRADPAAHEKLQRMVEAEVAKMNRRVDETSAWNDRTERWTADTAEQVAKFQLDATLPAEREHNERVVADLNAAARSQRQLRQAQDQYDEIFIEVAPPGTTAADGRRAWELQLQAEREADERFAFAMRGRLSPTPVQRGASPKPPVLTWFNSLPWWVIVAPIGGPILLAAFIMAMALWIWFDALVVVVVLAVVFWLWTRDWRKNRRRLIADCDEQLAAWQMGDYRFATFGRFQPVENWAIGGTEISPRPAPVLESWTD